MRGGLPGMVEEGVFLGDGLSDESAVRQAGQGSPESAVIGRTGHRRAHARLGAFADTPGPGTGRSVASVVQAEDKHTALRGDRHVLSSPRRVGDR